ncbi:ABC transporter permease [Brevundimonas naejangsanensis]|uniref:ABC transporter permease n=1 Tax=Brevundimonas naejangsanensis TaxID=588932 RepID=A0A494RR66_9CAUL|nr:ABC transporter permease [Brevundimonas naejangsanensis]AYG96024.1 ABC transporter permease [Brevundimonas naejangsanensis]
MKPRALDRKLGRDLWRMRWQVLAIALLIACGVSVAVMAFSAQRALEQAQADFYRETRFADVFAAAKRAPLARERDLAAIEGVTAVDARIVQSGLMDVPGLSRPAIARLISLPDDPRRCLNCVQLVAGRMPDPARMEEAVALRAFMDAAGVRLGDRLRATIGGRVVSFVIVGAVLSPEYVYVPAPESFMPDDAHQGVLWAPRRAVERATDMTGAFNAVALTVAPGVSRPGVLQEVDRVLAPYGGRAAYERTDQASHAFLTAELKELSISASVLPPVFLIVAAALVHLVVSRLVDAEREQIGLLKAFGYSDREAAANYVRMAAAIGTAGALGGGLIGGGFGAAIVDLYRDYFRFPELQVRFSWMAFIGATAVSIAAAMAGSLAAARRATALSPAVAMQPPRPASFRRGVLDDLFRDARIDQATRMIVRNLERFPVRAVLTTLGLAAGLVLLIGSLFLFDSLDRVVERSYFRSQRWSESVGFAEPRNVEAVNALARLPGVFAAEPVRVVAVRFRSGGREEMTRIVGLDPDAMLHRALGPSDRVAAPAGRGLVLDEALAARLSLKPGDRVWVEILDGRGGQALLPITGLARDYSGATAYMDRRALNRLMGEGDVASGAELLVAADARGAFYRAIEAAPQIVGSSSRDDTVAAWRAVMAKSFSTAILFYLGFAGAIAFGVAYNMCRISLAERVRDLATLRVLGFDPATCAYILLGELAVLALLAVPIGVLGGYGLSHGLVAAYSREDVRFPAIIAADSYGAAIGAYLIVVALAGGLAARRIWTFDLVAVLKTRE